MTEVVTEETLGQRSSTAISVFVGLAAAWWAFNHFPESMFGSYEKVNEDYRARLEATHVAISGLKTLQQQSGVTGSQATAVLEEDLTQIGEDYSDALKAVAKKRGRHDAILGGGSIAFGSFATLLCLLLKWAVFGSSKRRGGTATKATIHAIPLKTTASAPAPPLASPDDPTRPRSL